MLKFYTDPVRLYQVKSFLQQKTLSSKHVSIFYRQNMVPFLACVTAALRPFLRDAAHLDIQIYLQET